MTIPSVDRNFEQLELSYIGFGNIKLYRYFQKPLYLKKLKTYIYQKTQMQIKIKLNPWINFNITKTEKNET